MPLIDPNPLKVSSDPNGCCGIYQIDLISKFKTPQEVLRAFWEKCTGLYPTGSRYRVPAAKKPFLIFSCTPKGNGNYERFYRDSHADGTYGEKFKKYLEDMGLGLVMQSEERKNWNGNILVIYVCHLNWDKLIELMKPLDEEERQLALKAGQSPQPDSPPSSASTVVDIIMNSYPTRTVSSRS